MTFSCVLPLIDFILPLAKFTIVGRCRYVWLFVRVRRLSSAFSPVDLDLCYKILVSSLQVESSPAIISPPSPTSLDTQITYFTNHNLPITMAGLQFFNPKAGSPPYKSLFSNVAIVPPNTSIAYISTQWAADPTTGELVEGVSDDARKQAKIVWANLVAILKELGCDMKNVVHQTVSFKSVFQVQSLWRRLMIGQEVQGR